MRKCSCRTIGEDGDADGSNCSDSLPKVGAMSSSFAWTTSADKPASSAAVWMVLVVLAVGLIWLVGASSRLEAKPVGGSPPGSAGLDLALGGELTSTAEQVPPAEPAVEGEDWHVNLSNSLALDMVWCPPGTFTMGSPGGELGHKKNEMPHRVTLSKGFWIARYELTQEQYAALAGVNPSGLKGARRPVEQVSWDEAMAYCKKLNRQCSSSVPGGYKITLPTEAQWEYACRAGSTSALNSGRGLTSEYDICGNLGQVAWYDGNSRSSNHSVGQKQPNAWGLFDMHGNVWEWCADWYGSYGGSATDPVGPSTGIHRVSRGGSWNDSAGNCRSASRNNSYPNNRHSSLGFRPACAPAK